ncbi:MAG TPA: preprotein translocase subunit SecA, partial [Candidatus Paceibacterota bacterium]
HQAIEAKENVPIQQESRTVASITFQNYFRMYKQLAGMTGTALTSQEEFHKVYGLNVVAIPPNAPSQRTDYGDLIFQTERGKLEAIAKKVQELHEKGQPVLIGTASIDKNEVLSAHLLREGIPHEILNAKNHEREGEIIAQAGKRGRVTIATNMAGRGVDIKLGGLPFSKEAYEDVKKLQGLFVLGTERHEARRIDNQLRGRSGRQGDPGETQFFVSLEDSLMRVFASDTIKNMMGRFGIPEDQPIENRLITRSLEAAQTKIEGFHFDGRKHVLAYDDVLNTQRNAVYARRKRVLEGNVDTLQQELDGLIAGDEALRRVLVGKQEQLDEKEFYETIRRLFLQAIDTLWIEHLEVMDYTRGSVNLRAYGQRDPLIEYRKEGLRLFREMEASVDDMILRLLPNIGAGAFKSEQLKLRATHQSPQEVAASPSQMSGTRRVAKKIGRNETVVITNGTETKSLKFKKAEALLATGEWKLIESK